MAESTHLRTSRRSEALKLGAVAVRWRTLVRRLPHPWQAGLAGRKQDLPGASRRPGDRRRARYYEGIIMSTLARPRYMATATSSASDEWPTPQWLVDQLAAEFGPFDLDPAATAANAKAPKFYTREQDGLSQPWAGRIWLNPPYGVPVGLDGQGCPGGRCGRSGDLPGPSPGRHAVVDRGDVGGLAGPDRHWTLVQSRWRSVAVSLGRPGVRPLAWQAWHDRVALLGLRPSVLACLRDQDHLLGAVPQSPLAVPDSELKSGRPAGTCSWSGGSLRAPAGPPLGLLRSRAGRW